ncbi:hypothetical protein CR513_45649, partial [Mucuna pruriens]
MTVSNTMLRSVVFKGIFPILTDLFPIAPLFPLVVIEVLVHPKQKPTESKPKSEPNSQPTNIGSTQPADSKPQEQDLLRTLDWLQQSLTYGTRRSLKEDHDSCRRLSVGVFWKLFVSMNFSEIFYKKLGKCIKGERRYGIQSVKGVQVLSLRQRLLEVIDWYSWRNMVEGTLKAWTNFSEPLQSPLGSLPEKVAHDGVSSNFLFVYLGGKVVLKPLSLRKVCEDQIKMGI